MVSDGDKPTIQNIKKTFVAFSLLIWIACIWNVIDRPLKTVISPNNILNNTNGGQSVNHFSSNLIAVAMIMCIIGF